MADAYIGEIRPFAFGWAPSDWAFCNGQLLNTQQYQPLFAIIGNLYGGNAQQGTFAVPNLTNRSLVGTGQQPSGGTNFTVAQTAGADTVTLTIPQIPQHNHVFTGANGGGTLRVTAPSNTTYLTNTGSKVGTTITAVQAFSTNGPTTGLHPLSLSTVGGSQPHENRQPFLAIGYYICLNGIWPEKP